MDSPVALITGGASGIGRATARVLDAAGYSVALVDLSIGGLEAVTRGLSLPSLALQADVSSKDQVTAAVDQAANHFGRLDALVTCAGHLELVPLEDLSEETLQRMLAVHLNGTIYSVQAVTRAMAERRFGRIVCISSLAARKSVVTHSHYAAAKAGIIGFARSAAAELGPDGITINCILPGAIDTPMLGILSPEERAAMAETPVGRIGTPEDIAYAIRFFVSPEAGFITGATLLVTGGAYT